MTSETKVPPITLWGLIWQSFTHNKLWSCLSVFIGACGYIAYIWWPLYSKFLTQCLFGMKQTGQIDWHMMLPTLILGFVSWSFFGLPELANTIIAARPLSHLRSKIRTDTLQNIYQHSQQFFHERFAATISTHVTDLSDAVTGILNEVMVQFIPGFIYVACLSFVLFHVHPGFVLLMSAWIAMQVATLTLTYHKTQLYSRNHADARSVRMGHTSDSLNNHQVIRSFNAADFELVHAQQHENETIITYIRMVFYSKKVDLLLQIIDPVFIFFGIFGLFFYLFMHGKADPDDFLLLSFGFGGLAMNVTKITKRLLWFYEQIGIAQHAIRSIFVTPDILDLLGAKRLLVDNAQVSIENLCFAYQKDETVLKNISVVIQGGQKVGLVGYSGAGKTTFVNLLMRFYDVTGGRILIDGQDIAHVTQESLRRNIAMIPQDTSLFHRSLRENIRIACPEADDDDIIAAAKMAGAHDFIMTQSRQYDTLVGERGIKLSGGQRQRIAIARAFLKAAPILVLDEATSALDSMTEQTIQDALDKVMQNRTTLVIAHRLSTLRRMDRVLVFDKGRIVEDGSHDDLLGLSGLYAQMWAMQAGGFLPASDPAG